MSGKILIGTAVFLILIAGVLALFVLGNKAESFDSTKWKSVENYSLRYPMVDDLTKKYKLVGKSKKEMKDLLGKPQEETAAFMSWSTGMTDDAGDDMYLEAEFTKNGRVKNIEHLKRFGSAK